MGKPKGNERSKNQNYRSGTEYVTTPNGKKVYVDRVDYVVNEHGEYDRKNPKKSTMPKEKVDSVITDYKAEMQRKRNSKK